MKFIQSIIPVLAAVLVISCGNMKKDQGRDGGNTPARQFTTIAEAAAAAKEDMLAATDKVDFGVNREKLRTAVPGMPVMKYSADWQALLAADSAATPERIIGPEVVTVVPLVSGNDVITVVSLMNRNQKYSIGTIGDKQVTSELDMVRKATATSMQAEVRIYEIPNLQATIYAVGDSAGITYYTSYNGNSIRRGMDARTLMSMLKADAETFQKTYGDQLKKGELVR